MSSTRWFGATLMAFGIAAGGSVGADDGRDETERFRREREAQLKADDGG